MYIQIRTADGSQCKRVEVSRATTVENLKVLIEDVFNLKQDKQRLFFGGKQLVDNHTIFDYNIRLNDTVLLIEKTDLKDVNNVLPSPQQTIVRTKTEENSSNKTTSCQHFKVGDFVDALWPHYGAWFEGCVVQIKASNIDSDECSKVNGDERRNESLQYAICFNDFPDDPPTWVPLDSIRPQMQKCLPISEIRIEDTVLVNYNILNPNERGYWYDLKVTHLSTESPNVLKGTLLVGRERQELAGCSVKFTSEVFEIKELPSIAETIPSSKAQLSSVDSVPRAEKPRPKCSICLDDPKCRCKSCSCYVCGGKHDAHLQIICDECDQPYHVGCLNPPMQSVPQVDFWYCSKCKNDTSEIVKAGESLKDSKRKRKMPSSKSAESKRDWDKGMACVGRTKQCTIVPQNHFGPIPGIEVGTSWKFRVSAAEAGVHRPQIAGIHGREGEGAFSLVLSGGYEDDKDYGEEFYYTGSGGRDLSGNKRTAKQSCDQTLTSMNLALAVNCNARINKTTGAEADDWKGGKPVRVLRNYKAAKHSEFAPDEGNRMNRFDVRSTEVLKVFAMKGGREKYVSETGDLYGLKSWYDGIYKVVKYFPQKGESGFIVWRYLLRRDDPAPAPWTEEGQQRIKDLGLKMIYPDGYEEVVKAKGKSSTSGKSAQNSCESPSKDEEPASKRIKVVSYTLPQDLNQKVTDDILNEKSWAICKMKFEDGKSAALDEIQKQFMCIICQDLVVNPITTTCCHNICEVCLTRSFAAKVFSCPCCRLDLGKSYDMKVNDNLRAILRTLFPGYEAGR